MSTIQNTDYFQVDSGGTQYKISASDLRTGTKSYDYLAVNRSGTNYRLAKSSRYELNYTDYLAVNRSGTDYKVSGQDYFNYMWQNNQLAKITASDGAASDFFGHGISVGSNRIVVGANRDDDNGTDSGSAYIFDLSGNQLTKITASDGAAGDKFGESVAVGDDRIVVGAPGDNTASGAAYIFNLNGSQLTKITSSDLAVSDSFGSSVAIGDNKIVVGAPLDDDNGSDSGSAYIFDINGNQLAKITASDGAASDQFGRRVAVGDDRIVVGAPNDNNSTGSAYIFDLSGNQLTKITASDGAAFDFFGDSVSVGSGKIVIGAWGNDDPFSSGSAYIFDLNGSNQIKITASDAGDSDRFGYSVAVGDGRIIVGAYLDDDRGSNAGAAYIFDLSGNQLTKITASDGAAGNFFGEKVAVGDGRIIVNALYDDDKGSASGSAYIFN